MTRNAAEPVATTSPTVGQVRDMLAGGPALWLAAGAPEQLPASAGAVVETSGSTARPKRVVLSRAALLAAAQAAATRSGGVGTWHLALPSRYVAGLMVLVRAVVAGCPVATVSSDLSDLAPTGDGDAISIVPTQLHRAVADPGVAALLARLRLVLVGGAALDPELRHRAEAAGIGVVSTYGASESCGGCVWDGEPLPGTTVDLESDPGLPSDQGRVLLGGDMLFDGYQGDQDATRAALADGRFRTADRGRWRDGRLEVLGRLDDIVVTGGLKVDLGEVRRAAAQLDAESAVVAVADQEWGSRIVLFARGGGLSQWRDQLGHALPRHALPRQVVHVDELPRTAGGKPDHAALVGRVR